MHIDAKITGKNKIKSMKIPRNRYLNRLINSRKNGQIKIITGIRRCGKSFLLNVLFKDFLLQDGVPKEHIIMLELDNDINIRYRNPLELGRYIRELVSDESKDYYVLLDEIQMVEMHPNPYLPKGIGAPITFVDVLLGLKSLNNVDIYVTGSNSKMLSSDVATHFRDRGEEIRINPLTFDEFYSAFEGDKRYAFQEFAMYGGMPKVMQKESHEEKAKYLQDLFRLTFIKDVIERNHLKTNEETLDDLLNFLASSVGSLSNPTRLSNTFSSLKGIKIKNEVISSYIDHFIDAFILSKSYRYDVKGRSYISTPLKYYFTDIGLRNACLNFRQRDMEHIMENVLYNELVSRGFLVDVGVVKYSHDNQGKYVRTQLEVDFVVNKVNQRYYIQSAWSISNEDKRCQKIHSLNRINDSFTKIVVVGENILPWVDDKGVQYINVEDFLLKRIDEI